MAAVPMLAGVGLLSMCCISSSIASTMMGGEEKKLPDGNDAAGEAQAAADEAQTAADEAQTAADAVAADPNSTPEEVAAAKAKAKAAADKAAADKAAADKAAADKAAADKAAADKAAKDLADAAAAEAERVRIANMSFREKVIDGQYPTFAGCWAAAGPGTGSGADKFACCESIGTPYPDYGETGWAYCNDNT